MGKDKDSKLKESLISELEFIRVSLIDDLIPKDNSNPNTIITEEAHNQPNTNIINSSIGQIENIKSELVRSELDTLSNHHINQDNIDKQEQPESSMYESRPALPGQQSLFDDLNSGENNTKKSKKARKVKSKQTSMPGLPAGFEPVLEAETEIETGIETGINTGLETQQPGAENPFLPQRIKDRLRQEKQGYQDSKKQAVELNSTLVVTSSDDIFPSEQVEELVHSLTQEYLPKIEEELKSRLMTLAKQKLTEQHTQSDTAGTEDSPLDEIKSK